MKNKFLKTSLPLIGLSLALTGGILCNYSYAADCGNHERGGGYKGWSEPTCDYYGAYSTTATCNRKIYGWSGISYCNASKTYSYNDPKINSFSLNTSSNITSPNGCIFLEEGVLLDNLTVDASTEDEYAPYLDSIQSKEIEIIETSSNTTKLSVDLLSSGVSSFSLSTLPIGQYIARATIEDLYNAGTNSASAEETFYIGPYPTIYYNARLTDDNPSNHKDAITIENIKLLSTYKPNSLTFKIFANGTCQEQKIHLPSSYSDKFYLDADGNKIGYITQFDNFTIPVRNSLLGNILPLQKPYIMVQVNDGREYYSTIPDSTDPNAPKWAKYDNTYVPFL